MGELKNAKYTINGCTVRPIQWPEMKAAKWGTYYNLQDVHLVEECLFHNLDEKKPNRYVIKYGYFGKIRDTEAIDAWNAEKEITETLGMTVQDVDFGEEFM